MYARQFLTLFGRVRRRYPEIEALFAAGEQGVWYDPSDFSTLWQDAGATAPVTAAGQSVVRVLDKSGRGNHATFLNTTLAQDAGYWYLALNGTSSKGVTAAIDFTGTDKMTVWTGVRKNSDAATAVVVELSNDISANAGTFSLTAPQGASTNARFSSKGTSIDFAAVTGLVAPLNLVLTGTGNISGPAVSLAANAAAAVSSTISEGTGNYGNYVLNIGSRGGTVAFLNGRLYSLIVRGALSSAGQLAAGKTYTNSKNGGY